MKDSVIAIKTQFVKIYSLYMVATLKVYEQDGCYFPHSRLVRREY